jgi:hypothetical protein
MSIFRLNRLLAISARIEPVMALLWLGLAVFTVAVAILMYSRWGQSRPLRKCMALSLLAHLLLAGYSTTVQIIAPMQTPPAPTFHVSLRDIGPEDDEHANVSGGASVAMGKEQPWETFPNDAVAQPVEPNLGRGRTDLSIEPKRWVRAENAKLSDEPIFDHLSLVEVKPPEPGATRPGKRVDQPSPAASEAAIDAPAAQRRAAAQPDIPSIAVAEDRSSAPPAAQPVRTRSEDVPTALTHAMTPLPRMAENMPPPEPKSARAALPHAAGNPAGIELVAPRIAARVAESSADGDPAYGGAASAANAGSGTPNSGPLAQLASSGVRLPKQGFGDKERQGSGLLGSAANGNPPSSLGHSHAGSGGEDSAIPDAYRLRVAPNRTDLAKQQGGSTETEAAVKAALKWLADRQSADGHWDPRVHGAGVDMNVLGHSHQNAGSRADTGITGLALLAFLASGHTHRDGPYQRDVRRGLEYLVQCQAPDGNLGGQAALFEFMYCHAMATCALSEAYGMTHDDRLREPVEKAVAFTAAAQDPVGGGWRYKPGMPGDTSQLGWQLMALKSADLAGIPMPEPARQGIIRYLRSVGSGVHGGKASYRPGEQVTRTMSAEALVCWQFLGLPREDPASTETGDLLLGELPGKGLYNLYYWYYATLGMYNLGDTYWEQWNGALQKALVGRQIKQGPQAGCWEGDDLWGCHGGQIYTTAMATLTLEVYYRFLPLYAGVSTARNAPDDAHSRLK